MTLPPMARLLGALDCGNVDARARETEELNQTLTDYIEQGWPRPGEGGRGIIYVQPMQTMLAGGRKPSAEAASPELLRQVRTTPLRSWVNFSPFIAVFPEECIGQLASFGPT